MLERSLRLKQGVYERAFGAADISRSPCGRTPPPPPRLGGGLAAGRRICTVCAHDEMQQSAFNIVHADMMNCRAISGRELTNHRFIVGCMLRMEELMGPPPANSTRRQRFHAARRDSAIAVCRQRAVILLRLLLVLTHGKLSASSSCADTAAPFSSVAACLGGASECTADIPHMNAAFGT